MKPLILFYDGYCVFCNYWVQRLCHWDRKDRLRFSTLDSKIAKEMKSKTGFDVNEEIDSVIIWDQLTSPKYESEVVFEVIQAFGGAWKILLLFKLFPKSFLNFIYRIIAKNRYRWFGKTTTCPLPEVLYEHKFYH